VTSFVVPTVYKVVVVGPTIARPGSIEILGTAIFAAAHWALTTFAKSASTLCASKLFSPAR
jgi:hypothetical protein